MKTVSIVIPFYNNWTLTHQRMMELYTYVSIPIEIILVNDCSADENVKGGMGWWKTQNKHRVICIDNPKNLGFGGSMNVGANRATEDILIFLSNDVQMFGDIVTPIVNVLEENALRLVGNEIYIGDTGWNVLNINGKRKLFPYLAGYLLACTKEVWKDLGGFDDIYAPYDVEDIDISTMATHKGYDLHALNMSFVYHMSGQTIRKVNPKREEVTRRNLKKFQEKWSKILKDE